MIMKRFFGVQLPRSWASIFEVGSYYNHEHIPHQGNYAKRKQKRQSEWDDPDFTEYDLN